MAWFEAERCQIPTVMVRMLSGMIRRDAFRELVVVVVVVD